MNSSGVDAAVLEIEAECEYCEFEGKVDAVIERISADSHEVGWDCPNCSAHHTEDYSRGDG